MNLYAKVAAAAVVIVAVGVLGVAVLRPGSSSPPVGAEPTETGVPSASPTPEASEASSAEPLTPPLSETFTSTRNGISLATPDGWTTRPATESATEATWSVFLGFDSSYADVIHDPVGQGNLWLGIASIQLSAADADAWPNAQITATDCPRAEPVTVDGSLGYVGTDFHSTECSVAFVAAGGRGYQIRLYASDDAFLYDRDWFGEVLATVRLLPEDAVD